MLLNPEKQEYGDKRATIYDFGIFDQDDMVSNTINKLDFFSIKMKVKFEEDIYDPIFAFTIRDLKGTELCGTNTQIEDVRFGVVSSGEEVEVSFKQRMVLQNGQYLLQLGCTSYGKEELIVHHRLYDVCCIQVLASKITVGYFDMDTKVEYTRGETYE